MDKDMNRLLNMDRLSNRYFAMRHGHSMANQQGIIVSHPDNGRDNYGLSELGRKQVRTSLQQDNHLDTGTVIVTSDFKRARETAAIVHEMLACSVSLCEETRLRERNFGELELAADDSYNEVWQQDGVNPDSQARGVESVNQVMGRVSAVVADYEAQFSAATILFISHGDALQILQTAFARLDASTHRQLEHLHTAEIRQLLMTGNNRLS
jgi:probable phosphoglycerate mutase